MEIGDFESILMPYSSMLAYQCP